MFSTGRYLVFLGCDRYFNILTFPGLVRLKAVVDGRMVGFIGGEPEPARRRGWVTTLGVLPAFRRKGIALALLQRCEHELAMPIIRLSVRASNEAAIGLYEFAGYKISDRWAKYYIGGEDALIFEKHIPGNSVYTEATKTSCEKVRMQRLCQKIQYLCTPGNPARAVFYIPSYRKDK